MSRASEILGQLDSGYEVYEEYSYDDSYSQYGDEEDDDEYGGYLWQSSYENSYGNSSYG